jgi:hypothetical protein
MEFDQNRGSGMLKLFCRLTEKVLKFSRYTANENVPI